MSLYQKYDHYLELAQSERIIQSRYSTKATL